MPKENVKRLYLSDRYKKVAGVCGGIAEYFEVDPTLVRLLWVIFTLASFGAGVFAYIIAAILLPHRPASAGGSSGRSRRRKARRAKR